jgi:hypothetical protein
MSSESLSLSAHANVAEMRNGWQNVKPMKHNRGKTIARRGPLSDLKTVNIRA